MTWKLAVWLPSASGGPPSACMYPSCSKTPNLQVKELEAALEAERSKAASAVSERASTAGELAAIREQHAAELAAERQHYDRLLEVRWLTASVQWVVVGWQQGTRLLEVCCSKYAPCCTRPATGEPSRGSRGRHALALQSRRHCATHSSALFMTWCLRRRPALPKRQRRSRRRRLPRRAPHGVSRMQRRGLRHWRAAWQNFGGSWSGR